MDIIICTPGRLMDHLNSTVNFTLQHVRYLVMDEMDRLLSQSYLDWLPRLLKALDPHSSNLIDSYHHMNPMMIENDHDGVFYAPDGYSLRLNPEMNYDELSFAIPIQKLLFSATSTRNPEKLNHLKLVNPIFFSIKSHHRFMTPETLQEHMILCEMEEKPLILLHLILSLNMKSTLCFTSSLKSTHRLYRLLQLYGGISVAEYSSQLSLKIRQNVIDQFRQGFIRLLICSDGMARGMDLKLVENVISYDMPSHIKTYIHRVGRTARAGRQGKSFTFLHPDDVTLFKSMLEKTINKPINMFQVNPGDLQPYLQKYQESLRNLKTLTELEDHRGPSSSYISHTFRSSSSSSKDKESQLRNVLCNQLIMNLF